MVRVISTGARHNGHTVYGTGLSVNQDDAIRKRYRDREKYLARHRKAAAKKKAQRAGKGKA